MIQFIHDTSVMMQNAEYVLFVQDRRTIDLAKGWTAWGIRFAAAPESDYSSIMTRAREKRGASLRRRGPRGPKHRPGVEMPAGFGEPVPVRHQGYLVALGLNANWPHSRCRSTEDKLDNRTFAARASSERISVDSLAVTVLRVYSNERSNQPTFPCSTNIATRCLKRFAVGRREKAPLIQRWLSRTRFVDTRSDDLANSTSQIDNQRRVQCSTELVDCGRTN